MNIAIITSQDCPAGQNVKNKMLKMFGFSSCGRFDDNESYEITVADNKARLYTIGEKHIYAESLDKRIDADVFIFATTHRSSAGVKSLTVHAPGNWAMAEMGGRENQLNIAAAAMIKEGLRQLASLVSERKLDYDVIQEATHHGPYLDKPAMFIEIGSSDEQYCDEGAGKALATAIMNILESDVNNLTTAVGIGGLHYASNFKDIQLHSDIAIGHICPKYMLGELRPEQLRQAVGKTWPKKAEIILVDWKGLGRHKEKVKAIIGKAGIEWKKTRELKK